MKQKSKRRLRIKKGTHLLVNGSKAKKKKKLEVGILYIYTYFFVYMGQSRKPNKNEVYKLI